MAIYKVVKRNWAIVSFDREKIENDYYMEFLYISWAKNYFLQNYKSWNTLDPNFSWKSFTYIELEKFKNIAKKYLINIWVRD